MTLGFALVSGLVHAGVHAHSRGPAGRQPTRSAAARESIPEAGTLTRPLDFGDGISGVAHFKATEAAARQAAALAVLQQVAARPAAIPAPAPAPGAAPPAPAGGPASIRQIIHDAFAPLGGGAVSWAQRVAMCESGDNPNAENPSGHMGLFQFARSTWNGTPYRGRSPFDAVANARAAAWLYSHDGPGQWSCS
ncbi:MAG: transglycosylase family protein [Candidatus Dormibacteraceae bacterium]